jgi:3-dehydroquinate synthase
LHVLFFEGGEQNKRLSTVEQLAEQLSLNGADRKSVIIGFGGGIATDISGFVAAIFMRGLRVIHVPTTLLAQVDAATGGKTGVNLTSGKNLVGSFHQPLAVIIDPELLGTLSDREFRAGLFEVVKCGVIRDAALFRLFEQRHEEILMRNAELLEELISGAVRVKAEVVSEDEKEGDLRRILNFGHTVGHAIEAETGYTRFLHGEAVALGMMAAARIALLQDLLAEADFERIAAVVRRLGPLPSSGDLDLNRLISAMGRDKKTIHGSLHFVLPTRIGGVKVVSNVPEPVVRQAISETLL